MSTHTPCLHTSWVIRPQTLVAHNCHHHNVTAPSCPQLPATKACSTAVYLSPSATHWQRHMYQGKASLSIDTCKLTRQAKGGAGPSPRTTTPAETNTIGSNDRLSASYLPQQRSNCCTRCCLPYCASIMERPCVCMDTHDHVRLSWTYTHSMHAVCGSDMNLAADRQGDIGNRLAQQRRGSRGASRI